MLDARLAAHGLRRWDARVMGTDLVVLGPVDEPRTGDLALAAMIDWDLRFSRFRPDSELSLVNATAGRVTNASPELRGALRRALDTARATDGLFDPTLLRGMVAAGYDRTFRELPADRPSASAAAPRTGAWREIEIDDDRGTVRLPADAGIDLGGIAKGMAVDATVAALAARGIGPVAVSAGGDLAVHGTPTGLAAWPIELAEADGGMAVELLAGGLATSSVLQRRWRVGGEERHHLLDPRTGVPAASGLRSVSVIAADCTRAEVAAKVALLLGPILGAAFLDARALDGVLVADDGTIELVGAWAAAPGVAA
ncbi:MAG: FAD:protein FMN transferase [Chloroflexota bacterium]